MKIAVDAMGGDHAPEVVIAGVEKARDHDANLEFLLYGDEAKICLLYTSPSPRDRTRSRMPSSA
ncbi:fatty acid/phospholipid synthesis protein [Lactobacillus casei subsp. casei ATCC 393] [Lacticaseibacillus rhamnosus]|nr:fatty acid/phospholipid synthesis protein [Lactobacillus casei subsp. casei ATCC 393] [Lacticaseibacillus rhamnosus]